MKKYLLLGSVLSQEPVDMRPKVWGSSFTALTTSSNKPSPVLASHFEEHSGRQNLVLLRLEPVSLGDSEHE